ncbi:hypothetical protein [Coleofasciculus chthonoplastes]|jgi:hypothetical protein|uniref:hypothetical protein n=1 Tax=Coleofasciculus chthonoplastes TaxID=64178 RepID=UPI0032FF7D54
MSMKELVHSHHHWTIQEIESLLKPAFDTLILVTAIAFTVWLALGVQVEPSSGGSNSMKTVTQSVV